MKSLRIYHGPQNVCGTGGHIALGQRALGEDADCVVYQEDKYFRTADLDLRMRRFRIRYQLPLKFLFFAYCLVRYNCFHFQFGESFLPLNIDLPILRLFGKKVLMTYCGSDIRLIEVEQRRHPYAELLEVNRDQVRFDGRKKWRMRWHRIWVHRVFAIRNLYAFASMIFPDEKIISDIWVNNTIDVGEYVPETYDTKECPIIVHAPTERTFKGTAYLEAAIDELTSEGYEFEYHRLEGVPNDEAQRIYREEADVIVSGLLGGGLGTLTMEGMSAGKPVVAFFLEDVRERFCPDCPVVNASIEDVKSKLAWLIENPEERVRIGIAGRKFIEKYCDRNSISMKLIEIYRSL